MWYAGAVRMSLMAFISKSARPTLRSISSTSTLMASPAKQYVLRYSYIPDVLEKRGPHREKHLELAKKLCLAGGPTADLGSDVPKGALFLFEDTEKAKTFVNEDPYVSAGIVTDHIIEEWTVAVQN